jgi:two-component system sensor histidine kinase/response regulator
MMLAAALSQCRRLGRDVAPALMCAARFNCMSDIAANSATPAGALLKVLLAEDNVTNQKLAVAILKKNGHAVTVAENGRRAVELFEREEFDLVLMDMQMPEMDGIEATAAIRAIEGTTGVRTPIVAVTANAMMGDRERCLSAGMDDYLSKPLRADDLLKAIQRVVSFSKTMNPGSGSKAPVNRSDVIEVFDYAASVAQLEGDEELLGQLVSVFLGQLPSLLPPLDAAVVAGDAPAIRRTAHALSSSVCVLAAPRARNIARKLEALGLSADLSEAGRTHQELLVEFEALQKALLANPQLKAA